MTNNNILIETKNIERLITDNKLYDALKSLKPLASNTNNWEVTDTLAKCETSLHYMLEYFSKGVKDPSQSQIYNEIKETLYSLVDKIIYITSLDNSTELFYSLNRTLSKRMFDLENSINNYVKLQKELYVIDIDNLGENDLKLQKILALEEIEKDVFNYIWTSHKLSSSDYNIISSNLEKESFANHFKILIISSLFLGLCRSFDKSKLNILFDTYGRKDNPISIISLTCILLIIEKYENRIKCNSTITDKLKSLLEVPGFENDLISTVLQIINSQDTDRISRKVHEDLMPKIMKIYPDLLSKLKRTSGTVDLSDFESNPKWGKLVNDDKFINKIEELNKIQSEGGDVFISSFSHLKSFPFFDNISNWFLPFHKHSSVLNRDMDTNQISSIISHINFLCDSDRYSFLLSLSSVPSAQKNMLLSQLSAQSNEMNEIKSSEVLPNSDSQEMVINKYLQNLYRFFNFFNRRNEFYNPFAARTAFHEIEYFKKIFANNEKIIVLGEFYFKREMYSEAAKCFETSLSDSDLETNPVLYQKLGFCYQHLNEISKAITAYKHYELFNAKDIWNVKHLASCYKINGQIDKAVDYYKIATEISPENAPICINLGNALLECNKVDEALQSYFKADYLETKNHRAWSPIAWCLFLKDDYEQSEKYFKKILDTKPTSQDLINYGHLLFVLGRISEAVDMYIKSASMDENGISYFANILKSDSKYLKGKNITDFDISLILDAVKMKFEK